MIKALIMNELLYEVGKVTFLLGILNNLRYFLVAGIPFLIFYIFYSKKFQILKIQLKEARKSDFLREIKYSLLSGFITAFIVAFLLRTSLKNNSLIYSDLNEYPTYWLLVSYALSILFHDTWFYWLHRFFHVPWIYKHVHNVHHLSVNPSPWTSFSFHFFEAIGEGLVIIPLAFIVPLHPYTLVFFGFSIFAINVYGHLGYEIAPKWFRQSFLFELINTSVYHNLHHSKFKGNYGLYFRIWDRMMGTENKNYVEEFERIQARRHINEYSDINIKNKA